MRPGPDSHKWTSPGLELGPQVQGWSGCDQPGTPIYLPFYVWIGLVECPVLTYENTGHYFGGRNPLAETPDCRPPSHGRVAQYPGRSWARTRP
jgi:hypothetical protein